MQDAKLKTLGEEIEAAQAVTGDVAGRARAALEAAGHSAAEGFGTVDAVLAIVDRALPGWAVTMEGWASADHGHWTCSLRRSRERDNDEVIGVGKSQHLVPALLAALIKVLSFGPRL
jgi:hypothetical protein